MMRAAFVVCALALAGAVHAKTLDDFSDASAWKAVASDQISATLKAKDGALCLDFDFHGVSGYAGIRRELPIDYPPNYEFRFRLRGDAPDNALQFKLTDAKAENVWWVNRPDFTFPHEWTTQRYRKRQVAFAWGPLEDRTLRHSDAVEFTLYAGKGGRGEVCFDDLEFRELPLPPAVLPAPSASASSSLADDPPSHAIDGDAKSAWKSDPTRGADQTLTLDLGLDREFGGLVLHWLDGHAASDYEIALSDDDRDWRIVRRVAGGNGGVDPLYLPDASARWIRVSMHGRRDGYALGEIDIEDLGFGASANAFFSSLARTSPRGWYPRGFHDEQTYWTVVGTDGGHESGLLSEDGAIEVARGGFSIAPFLVAADGTATSWADVSISHALKDRYLPMPSATWHADGVDLAIAAFADGDKDSSRLLAKYTISNTSDRARDLTLALVVQPFQVNPAVQFLNTSGGVSPIHDLAIDARRVAVDGEPRVFALEAADGVLATKFDAGMAFEHLAEARATTSTSARVHDTTGLASGALVYRLKLAPHEKRVLALAIPLDGPRTRPELGDARLADWIDTREDIVARRWRDALGGVAIEVPPSARTLIDTVRTALADILISRDGPELRPGTRSYARSWIRDGAMMSEALLRLGRGDVARDYLEWYAPYQFRSGKVPCCVDKRGSDPVPENDSHGELIHLAAEVWRYGRDRALLEKIWPHVDAAIGYMDALRKTEQTPANRVGDRAAFYGLMPASISHEGYSAKPMHSYWDNFWALTGYDDAAGIARALGRDDDAKRIAASRDAFDADLHASIRTAVAQHGIDYVPGCAELGDFDATSTTIALTPAGQLSELPRALVDRTFERYWTKFEDRARGRVVWKDYTPYEWRTVASFVRLGWRDRAQQAIAFFMHDRRPPEWNQWAEVVGRDPRESRFVGDMPHGWVASDFIRSVLDLFAYERASDGALVIAAGVPDAWLDDDGIAIDRLRTPYGAFGYSMRRDGRRIAISMHGGDGFTMPRGGIVVAWPKAREASRADLDGKPLEWDEGGIRIGALPAKIEIDE